MDDLTETQRLLDISQECVRKLRADLAAAQEELRKAREQVPVASRRLMAKFDQIITLDFETYYSQAYSLSKMTTEEYVRHPEFHAQMLGVKINADKTFVLSPGDIQTWCDGVDWKRTAVVMHNAHFDGLILSHHFKTKPVFFFDTLSMARGLHGHTVGNSLGKLAPFYGLGQKGRELASALGVKHLPPELYRSLSGYCANDVELTYRLFMAMRKNFPRSEYDVIDAVIKVFTRPLLDLDQAKLKEYIVYEQARKENLISDLREQLGFASDDEMRDHLQSNQKFADMLIGRFVDPPMKISPTTGKPTLALAKTDKGMTDLLEHEDELVRDMAAARLGTKSSINETRALRMLGMGQRGKACVYLSYSGAWQTHRLSGGDKMNWQNFPSRGGQATLRRAVRAPKGTKMNACDSANIEMRINMALSGERAAVEALRSGEDLYCAFASRFYGRPITKADKPERMLGKVAELGLGYGMGADKFRATARIQGGLDLSPGDCEKAVGLYRAGRPHLKRWWYQWSEIIPVLASGRRAPMHEIGIYVDRGMIHLPTGLPLHYPDLQRDADGEWSLSTRRGRAKVYGSKLVENVTQAIARNIVMEQTVTIAKKYPVVMSVHDEVVFLCRDGEEEEAMAFAVGVMSASPSWFPDLPLAAEAHAADNFGDCK